jgi:hypothetical protein
MRREWKFVSRETSDNTGGNLEQRAFDLLVGRPLELCEACRATPLNCESIRQAFDRLRKRGIVDSARAGAARFFFLVPTAVRPVDQRGACRRR